MDKTVRLAVSDFVESFNQTIDYTYSKVAIIGELANFKIKSNGIIYFDLKDSSAKVEFFGSMHAMKLPMENGMLLEVVCTPRLHPQYGFKLNVYSIKLIGEGTIKRAQDLLKNKLFKEGLFDDSRKRPIIYPPKTIGVITAIDSAAFADFKKILANRFSGLKMLVINVLVQGDKSADMVSSAIEKFNSSAQAVDVIVIIRGGGSPEDLQSFSSEQVTRSVAVSRIPTVVAIGHEVDISLAELAADKRASTPSNAAELLVPDKKDLLTWLKDKKIGAKETLDNKISDELDQISYCREELIKSTETVILNYQKTLINYNNMLESYDPYLPVRRGYALIKHNGKYITLATKLKVNDQINIEVNKYKVSAKIDHIKES